MSTAYFSTPEPTPPRASPSSEAPKTKAQSVNPTTNSSSHRMSISSLLQDDTLKTPPLSTNTSFDIGHAAAQAHQILALELTTSPVNDAELSATAAIIACRTKGKGRDPELYNANATEVGSTETRHVDGSEEDSDAARSLLRLLGGEQDLDLYDHNRPKDASNTEEENRHVYHSDVFDAAQSLLRVRYVANGIDKDDVDAAFGLVDLRYDLRNRDFDQQLDDDSNEDENENEDEGSPTARKPQRSCTDCHGKKGAHHHHNAAAHEGDALFDLLAQRFVNRGREELCWPCFLSTESIRARYERGYERVGWCGGSEREETVSMVDDDDGGDVGEEEEYGDEVDYRGDMLEVVSKPLPPPPPSPPPLLSQKTLDRLEKEKREWRGRAEADLSLSAATTTTTMIGERTSSSFASIVDETVRLTRASMYAKESHIRHLEAPAPRSADDKNNDVSSSHPRPLPRRRGIPGSCFSGRRKEIIAPPAILPLLPASASSSPPPPPPPPPPPNTSNPNRNENRNRTRKRKRNATEE